MSESLSTDLNNRIVSEPSVTKAGFNALGLAFNLQWWKNTFSFIWTFKKLALKPALFCTAGEICAVLSLYLSWSDLLNRSPSQPIPGNEVMFIFLKMIIVMLIFGGAALILTTTGVGLWILTITGFCRSFLTDYDGLELTEEALLKYQRECIDHFKTKKAYLFVVWIIYTIIMTIPLILFSVPAFFLYISIPKVIPYPIPLTMEMKAACSLVCAITGIIMTNHFLTALPLSAISNKGGQAVAIESLIMALKTLPTITIFSIFLTILCTLLYIPEYALFWYNTTSASPSNFVLQGIYQACSAIWHGAISIVLVPLAVALPCEILRNKRKVVE